MATPPVLFRLKLPPLSPIKERIHKPSLVFSDDDHHNEDKQLIIKPPTRSFNFSTASIKSKGLSAVQIGQLPNAVEAFSTAVTMDPVNQHLYLDMVAQLFLAQDETFKAIITCDKAIKFNPGYYALHHTRSRALFNFGELDQAIAELETALVHADTETNNPPPTATEIEQMKEELADARRIRQNINDMKLRTNKLSVCLNDRIYGDVDFYTKCDQNLDVQTHGRDVDFLIQRLKRPNCCNL